MSKKPVRVLGDDIDKVPINPFNEDNIIGTRMEIQLSGVIADLLLKTHSILPYASNQVIERHLTWLEAYFDPYLSKEEKTKIADLDGNITKKIDRIHPVDRNRLVPRMYNDYIEAKLKVLMNCAYKQDMIPGRIRTMDKL